MKLPAALLAGSLAFNAAALAFCAFRPEHAPPGLRNLFSHAPSVAELAADSARARAATAAQRQAVARSAATDAQLWSALDSADLPTLIAHLRAAGFPPAVIRAVASAQIQVRFTTRMQALVGALEATPYWRTSAVAYNTKLGAERSEIHRERTRLLRDLLGDDLIAANGGDPTAEQRRQFGEVPKAKIDLIQRINDDYAEMLAQLRAGRQGVTLPEDREKLALLEREKRADLATLFSPAELADYELRNSAISRRLRDTVSAMDASEEEFRTLFRIQQQFDDRIFPPGGVFGAEMSRRRREATDEMNTQIAAALGPARAADFVRASDYDFRNLSDLARRDQLPPTTAVVAWDLRAATIHESTRIGEDPNLTWTQKRAALGTLAATTTAQLTTTLGAATGATYAKGANWLQAIKNGMTVRQQTNGGLSFQPMPLHDDPPK